MSISINNNYNRTSSLTETNNINSSNDSPKKTQTTEEYFKKLQGQFPELKLNMTNMRLGSATEPVINLSPKLVEKMSKDPKLAEKVENDLKYEGMAFNWYKAMCRANGQEVTFNCHMYDENGDSYGFGSLKTADGNNTKISGDDNSFEKLKEKLKKEAIRRKMMLEKERLAKESYAKINGAGVQNKYYMNNYQDMNINLIDTQL